MQSVPVRRPWSVVRVLVVLALVLAPCAPLFAADEQHQPVRAVQLNVGYDAKVLTATLRLANGDEVKVVYNEDAVTRMLTVFDLGMRPGATLYVDLKDKRVQSIYVEYGRP